MTDMEYYKLMNKKVKKCKNIAEYLEWRKKNSNVLLQTSTSKITVSTVFLGLNHRIGKGKPLVFETMIFGGKYNHYQERYSSYKEAIQGHLITEHIANKELKILKALLKCIIRIK